MSFPRILFVLKERDYPYGCDIPGTLHLSSGLFNSAKFVSDMLASLGFKTKLVHVQDNNAIHKEIVEFKANVVIIEAYWVVPEKFDVLKAACPNVTFVIRNHSDIPFLANEGSAIGWTLKYIQKSNVVMSCNAHEATSDFRFLASKEFPEWSEAEVAAEIPYLPNYYPTENALIFPNPMGDRLKVGCFGAIRPLKNQLLQAIASMKFAKSINKPLDFHINGTRVEMYGSSILKNLLSLFDAFPEDNLVMHNWQPHDQFMQLIGQMDIVLQVSYSETFNIVSADAVVSGVPVVTSDKVPWVASRFKANEDDTNDIVAKMGTALASTNEGNLFGLEQYNTTSIRSWMTFLSRF